MIDGYEKGEKIGEGTYGKVYKSVCQKTGKMVAIKQMKVMNSGDGLEPTTMREISLLQMLSNHRHIVKSVRSSCKCFANASQL